jgi:DNA-binding CsgD family transcriptional regulator
MELIERADFLSLLQTKFDAVAEGEGHAVFLAGEAGLGKTALVKAFCKKQDCTVYLGACDALFTPRPLAPLYDILWQVNPDLWPGSQNIEERTGMFAAFFRELSKQRDPFIIVFEDIHWADEATLDFIKFFARRISQLPCLFLLTYREEETNARSGIRNVLGQLSPSDFSRIQLTPLSKEVVEKMAGEKGYNGEDVFDISGGNPFYVNEILASYSPGVPENIKDAILSVYDRQEEGTKNAWHICSVIPEGIEISRYAKIKASWNEGIDQCFALRILIIKNDRVIFKHELYRRTIEQSLSPFKRIALNKTILDLFLDSFEENGEIERIVQYAKNANENALVFKYAPIAARQAAGVGAHVEASKLYLAAIEYGEGHGENELVEYYEAYAYECYLTNQVKEAIFYQAKALKVWKKFAQAEKEGDCLRFLSRLYWFDGNNELAETCAAEAIRILEPLPSSSAKAMAFSNLSQLKMFSEDVRACVDWGNRAIAIAREIGDEETLCHALNNVGASQWKINASQETGKKFLLESLALALKNSYHEQAARAYSNIIYNCIEFKEYALTEKYLLEGIAYCEERGLDASLNYKLSMKARMLLDTGSWAAAAAIAEKLLENPAQPGTIRVGCLVLLATIRTRSGEGDPIGLLEEAKTFAFQTGEPQRIIPVIIALLENEWLTGKKIVSKNELETAIAITQKVENIFLNSEFEFWLQKARQEKISLQEKYTPYKLLDEGKWEQSSTFWEGLGCPYEKAFALFEGNEPAKKTALQIFQQLGAGAVAEKIKMEMRAEGIKNIPRGIRESTKSNPAQLTNRELEVLRLLKQGIQNKEIAGALFISPKTADNHISSILFKLDVNTRARAVSEAIRLGILN